MTAIEILKKQLEERNADLSKLLTALNTMEIEEERSKCNAAIEACNRQIAEITDALNEEARKEAAAVRNSQPNEARNTASKENKKMDYRNAFRDYVTRGIAIPEEFRADATTKTTDIGAAIPANLLNQIFEGFEDFGELYALVTKTSYPVGQTIAKDGVKPVATWVAEGATSDRQKKTTDGTFTFAHFKLRCEIAQTEEAAVMSIDAFEALFVKQVTNAMIKAIEGAIVSGNGTSQPTGILTTADATTVGVATSGITYENLLDMEGNVRADKETTAKWVMAKKTFMSILGIKDGNGQPIARVNYGIAGRPERYLLGREVVLYTPQDGSKLGVYSATAASGTIVAFIADMSDYVLNTNYSLGVTSKVDWDTEDHLTKAVLACDGKFVETGDALVEMVIE